MIRNQTFALATAIGAALALGPAADGAVPPCRAAPASPPDRRPPMDPWLLALTQFAVLAYAALGGVFLAFSDFLMRALARSPGGAEAMQSINREVFRIVFMALFLGMVPVSLILAISGWLAAPEPARFLLAAGLYLLGCFAVTAMGNVPLNDRLAGMDAATPEAQGWWDAVYLPRWTRLNTLRTLACFAAAATLIGALG
jgi:uncharacterized membrane protein